MPGCLDSEPPRRIYRSSVRYYLLCCALLAGSMCSLPLSAQQSAKMDPSGEWRSVNGALSLMLADEALAFSYSSVFGTAAHICDVAGAAVRVAENVYHYIDAEGTVAFTVDSSGVRLSAVDGIPSFCGSGWPGEYFKRDAHKPPAVCTVSSAKSYFHAVHSSPPKKKKSYVIRGDRVDVLPAHHEGSDGLVLVRFRGRKAPTVGLVKAATLACPR